VLPSSVALVAPEAGYPARVGRTIAALRLTMEDLAFSISPVFGYSRNVPGLRGGSLEVTETGLRLRDFEVIGGMRLTGGATLDRPLRLRVTGPEAAQGTVAVQLGGQLSGTLDGRRVRVRL
jgi:hypothetical protein